ncbi:hypothetical protein RhiirA5_507753 [Rhizophagus irregularis]|uniref:Uncharacterized protein n=1 Tax=Rhizophagus irregularis TaxID=588596 RepID=A0A2N0NHG9_9GLOM|nr:hypothetical protein RhiirA5_507753 [Rhizophagus irregularis]
MDLKQQKIEEEIQKAKKRYSEQTSEKEKSKTEIKHRKPLPADEMISIDQPIVDLMKMIKSGINLDNSPNVNHSSKMEIIIDIPVMKQIENMPLLQAIPQLQNIIMDLTKSSNKKKKSNKHLVQQAITGHIPTNEDTLRVRDILTVHLSIELSTFRLAQFEVNENPVWTTDLGGIPVR